MKLNFPAIRNDIGAFFSSLVQANNFQNIFEFGSGYGHSCFWYLVNNYIPKEIVLTEKRDDLKSVFYSLPWSEKQKECIEYFQGDAFDRFEKMELVDFLLIDGTKADYKRFLELSVPKLKKEAVVVIDNAFWKGSVVHDGVVSKKSESAIRDLHEYLKSSFIRKLFTVTYLPFRDGLVLLQYLVR